MDRRQMVGLFAIAALVLGCFVPILHAPLIGDISYFNDGDGDGKYVLIMAFFALLLVLANRTGLAVGIAILAGLLITFSLLHASSTLSDGKAQAARDLAGNPFGGFAMNMINSASLSWGWSVLYVGCVALVVSGLMNSDRSSMPAASRVEQKEAPLRAFPVVQKAVAGRYRIVGVDRETRLETTWYTEAETPDNARVKAELEGIIVTSLSLDA